MARKKPAPKIPAIDQFKTLLREVRNDLSRLGKQATADLASYQAAVDFARQHKLSGAEQLLLSVLLHRQDKDAEALSVLESAQDLLPDSLAGHRWSIQGVILRGLKRFEEAIECLAKALDTPGYDTLGNARNNMGLAYVEKKEYERAIECYQKALDTPGYDNPHLTQLNLASVLREQGEYERALDLVQQVLNEPDTEGQHTRARYLRDLIQEKLAGIQPTPSEEALASSSVRSDPDSPETRMKLKLQGSESDQRDKYEHYLHRPASTRDNVFSCLRGWSSSVTLLEGGNDSHWRGGGYFLKWQGRGIVIDPGFDFIDNFHDAKYTGKEISAVLVSHNHSDHNYDLRSLDDLRFELHKRWKTKRPAGIELQEYAVVVDEDTRKGFDVETADFRKLLTFDIKKSVRKKWLDRPVDIPLTVEHFPVEHGDDVSHAVGMRLVFHSETGGKDFIVGYTGDTEYFDVLPDHLQGCDLLIAHISMPDAEELGDDQDSANHVKKRHLGLNGTARLIQEAKPKLALIGEFWAGRADIRIELIQALRKRTGTEAILPTGIGFHLHLPTLDVECTNCQKRVPYDGIRIAPAASAFGPLGYLCANCFM